MKHYRKSDRYQPKVELLGTLHFLYPVLVAPTYCGVDKPLKVNGTKADVLASILEEPEDYEWDEWYTYFYNLQDDDYLYFDQQFDDFYNRYLKSLEKDLIADHNTL